MFGGAAAMISHSRSRTITVEQGIFALRYVASAAGRGAPRIVVEPFTEPGLSLVAAPGAAERALNAPGDCILIRAERQARVTLTASGTDSSLDADLRLERLSAAAERAGVASLGIGRTEAVPRIGILAHLARRGDVPFAMGAWIGGPTLPTRIEGLAIGWSNRPADVDLLCSVVSRGRRLRHFTDCGTDVYAGTRGEAAPLVGIRIALSGAGAARYALNGQALFLGAPILAAAGESLHFASPTGREALVGLQFTLASVRPSSGPDVRPTSAPLARPVPGRVRMFRGASMPAA
jgi:hypothetical protein